MRTIHSFVRRAGRLTPGQARARTVLLPQYGVPDEGELHPAALFPGLNVAVLEIGFGNGASLLAQALAAPEVGFLGVEVHPPGVGQLLAGIAAQQLTNVRVVEGDVLSLLPTRLVPASWDGVQIFFPDPWPKMRHHKRRLIQPALLALLKRVLKPDGWVSLATDWADYGLHMQAVFAADPTWQPQATPPLGFPHRPGTKFERRGQRLGHAVLDLYYQRVK
jgi:tRNA (guanine-N7-)-methyltransferase